MLAFKSVCVFCGSSPGNNSVYMKAAHDFGAALAREKIRLVYGGGHVGMMGALSQAVTQGGGKVLGVIPEFLVAREHAHEGKNDLKVVRDMHERKRIMVEEADAFVALPGGVGTLEELVEQLTWLQLERHKKPILLANIEGYWNPLIKLFEHMLKENFLYGGVRSLVADRAEDIVPKLRAAVEVQGEDAKAVAGGM
jgi:uncharacterized protein (TIGR00730 family)